MNDTLKVSNRTKFSYSIGCIGRDMAYTLFSTYLIVFFTNAVGLPDWELLTMGVVIAFARVWDAINDPMMGIIIDNTRSRWGKFKPWILIGSILSAICIFLIFQDYGLTGVPFVVVFGIIYVLLGMTFTMNDISYWSMYPSFTIDPKEREKIGSLARIFASLGMFIVIAFVPIFYPNFAGGPIKAFFWLAVFIPIIFIACQLLVVFGVKEGKSKIINPKQDKTPFKDILKIIFKNDQLVVIIISILLFNIGYFITTALGIYFFEYDFQKYGGVEFTIFSGILAVSQLTALSLFPILTKKFTRKRLFTYSIIMVTIGYLLFMSVGYVLPQNMIFIGIAGLVLFFGQGIIQVLVLVMLADTIEYGQWKLKTRNESVVFSINPFVTKLASAFQAFVVTWTLGLSGLNRSVINPLTEAKRLNPDMTTEEARAMIAGSITPQMILDLRLSMIVIPLILIFLSYFIYRRFYKIDTAFYKQITDELALRVESKEEMIQDD